MITIALDEQGDFENLEGKLNREPVFIGGIVYDDVDDETDLVNEQVRLERYLKRMCLEAGGRYPNDLHVASHGGTSNRETVKQVKTRFGLTIKEFMEHGTWNGRELLQEARKGKYYIFISMRGRNGKKALLSSRVSEVVREDFASNLYVHMAEEVVMRLLFHNPILQNIRKFKLELATRRVILKDGAERYNREAKRREYEKLGFHEVVRENGSDSQATTEYQLTNPTNYRTAIEREMLQCENHAVMTERIGVKSIYYDHAKTNMVFLYLADAVCSHLSYNREGTQPHEWIESFFEVSKQINPRSSNMIWAYDEADEYFSKGLRAAEEKDFYLALGHIFDGIRCTSTMRDFYTKYWYPLVIDFARAKADPQSFSMAIRKLNDSIMSNELNQEKLIYIYEVLEKTGEEMGFVDKKQEAILYHLYDAGVSAYTHMGRSEKAKQRFEKTKQYAEYVSMEAFLRTRNKMVVFLCDTQAFDEALKISDENVVYHEMLSEMKKQIFQSESHESLNHAKALSQRAQVYAFMENDNAEIDFTAALGILDRDTPDYLITESYLMHYYIASGNKKGYEECARHYYGERNSLKGQFDYIARKGAGENARFALKYALYVYIKALYTFYSEDISPNGGLLNKLKGIEKALTDLNKNAENQINGHPWELIYKYVALIMIQHQQMDEARRYMEKIEQFAQTNEGLLRDIANAGWRVCNDKIKGNVIREDGLTLKYMHV